jgi:1-phosphofructokinase family hexose kinase
MVLTVTLNPMLDKTIHVSDIRKGKIERASAMEMVVGGKGVNVSRQLHRWGQNTVATGFFGGEIGSLLERLLDGEGIPHDFVRIRAMTREGLTFLDEHQLMTCVFEPAAVPTREEAEQLVERALGLAERSEWVVCSGSSPGAAADDVFARIISGATSNGVRTILDSYGPVCRAALEAQPTIVKMNREEYEHTLGMKLTGDAPIVTVMEDVIARGSTWAIVTDGARFVYAASSNDVWRLTPPGITPVNPTGSGDSMVAGVLYGLKQSWSFDRALQCGVAAGALNASRWEVAVSPLEDVLRLTPAVRVERM